VNEHPLRFCMITTFYPPYSFGGDGVSVHHLSNALAARGHRVDVIHCVDSYRLLARREPAATYEDHPNVSVHGLRSRFGLLSPLATHQTGIPFFKRARIRAILSKGVDVIHYHNISLVGGPAILQYGQGIKLYTMREYWLVCPTHVLFRFNRTTCTRPYCLLCSASYRRPPQWWRYSGLLRAGLEHVDAFIGMSRFSIDMQRRMGLDVPFVHLPSFVSSVPLAPLLADRPEAPYFLFVGRLEKIKGLQTLLPVFRRYRKARLLIVGEGDYEPRLRRLAGGDDTIRFLGRMAEAELQPLYRGATALIVPSICFDIYPLVILEAFRQQTPAIGRNIGGIPEMIQESGGGVVYDTEEELVAAMDRLLAEPRTRRELGMRGYEAYRRKWTEDAHVAAYLELIRGLRR
jgi:glycosyltransferase involved in cell wall biosynthesis